jgi:hypothetical protein
MGGHIRNYGVYRLPDGTEIVAKRQINDELFLYSQENYDNDGEAEYRLENYDLLKNGNLTGWTIRDMRYTGRNVF